ncbi:MAG: nucleotide exchange factor GrpE [Vicinamibacterales bacterium]|nr:nucleotide exchange factor GrpE [Vicinamibacterales bacterium]
MAFEDPTNPASRPDSDRDEDTSVRVIDRRWWARAAAGDTAEDAAPRESDKPVYVQELEQRLAAKDDELRQTIARYREASNEFDEMRARIRRDTAREGERSRRQVFADLLDVIDNLDRAIDAARTAHAAPALLQGVELVRAQFLGKFESHGVARVESLGQRFDPERHEAATTVPVSDPRQDGVVVGIIREGYTMGGDMLRPAMVAVGRFANEGAAS